MEQYHVFGGDGVGMNLDGVLAVFFHVRGLARFGRQLAGFATHDESGTQTECQSGAHYEAAALDADYLGDALVLIHLVEFIYHDAQTIGVLKQGADVLELDSLDGEVGHVAEILK